MKFCEILWNSGAKSRYLNVKTFDYGLVVGYKVSYEIS